MSDDPRTVEGALNRADGREEWATYNPSSSDRVALKTLAAEVRRLQAQAKPDTVACAEAAVVRAAESRKAAIDKLTALGEAPPSDIDEYTARLKAITMEVAEATAAIDTACAALAQARKEGA
jgi:hypothetical protein